MGLDIYLQRYDDYKSTKEREDKFHEFSEALWESAGGYETVPDEIKLEIEKKCDEYSALLGLDKWGSDNNGSETIQFNSTLYPDHYFKVGYFRSSYNEGGIERILRNLGLPTLSDIFNHVDYLFQPNWKESLYKVTDVIEQLKETGAYRVQDFSPNIFAERDIPTSSFEALQVFLKEQVNHADNKYNYSNIHGDFFMSEPLKVLAILPGKKQFLGERQCIYAITESDNTWYINALEIVKETIEFVLSQENKEQYYLHWSG